MNSGVGVKRSTPEDHSGRAGAVPSTPLHFHTNKVDEAAALVMEFHYSRRPPGNVQFVGTWHEEGGLFGDQGQCVAAAFFSSPPTRWREPVLELTRLVRRDDFSGQLSQLLSICCRHLKAQGHDLLVSFADKTQGHEGGVYVASGWKFACDRDSRMDGVMVGGTFIPGRTANALWGTQSPKKLREILPHKSIEPHYDKGKRLFWKALGKRGIKKAQRLGLA